MRKPVVVLIAVSTVAFVGLALTALLRETATAFTVGVAPAAVVAVLPPGSEACQGVISVPAAGSFDRVSFQVGTFQRPGSRLSVSVREEGGRVIARGVLPAGYPDVGEGERRVVDVGRVAAGTRMTVCVRNRGNKQAALYGTSDLASRDTTGTVDGQPLGADLDFVLKREPRPVGALLPAIAHRASLFSPAFGGAWLPALLAALSVLGTVALLAWGLRASLASEPDIGDERDVAEGDAPEATSMGARRAPR